MGVFTRRSLLFLLLARLGNREKPGNSTADLWNLPLAEKKEIGTIYTDLTIIDKQKSDPGRGYDVITLSVPDQGENFLSNFRNGDSVYLYAYQEGEEPDARRSLLYKGTLTQILSDTLTVVLSDGQQNPNLLEPTPNPSLKGGESNQSCASSPLPMGKGRGGALLYALEHCDLGGSTNIKALAAFAAAAPERRRLLLGLQSPRTDATQQLSRSYHPHYDDIVLRARQALDYFLLVGPPGTGKTSMALRYLVEEHLSADNEAILLTAYTNRAVDEICEMLNAAGFDYLAL